jgi:glycosyltransferase involved in cell wall biosynthesis
MPDDLVSILIPCYNAEQWVGIAIESCLKQTYPHAEIIVVDDGSSDQSVEIIKSYQDKIHWESAPHQGGNRTRNRLLELSKGNWIQYLDADDYLQPGKIAAQMQALSELNDTDVVYGPTIKAHHRNDQIELEEIPIPPPHDPWILLATWHLPQTGSPLWKKKAILNVNGWDESFPCCQEHELYSRLLIADKKFTYTDDSGSVYRQWSDETICRKDLGKVHHYQTIVRERIYEHLSSNGELTPERLDGICQGHFETARLMWSYAPDKAAALSKIITRLNPSFIPKGPAAPPLYRKVFRTFGFATAEKVAGMKRKLLPAKT